MSADICLSVMGYHQQITLANPYIGQPPPLRKGFLLVTLSLCRMMYVQSFTLESCFQTDLLKVGISLIVYLILRGGPKSMIRDVTNRLEVSPGSIYDLNKCDVKM